MNKELAELGVMSPHVHREMERQQNKMSCFLCKLSQAGNQGGFAEIVMHHGQENLILDPIGWKIYAKDHRYLVIEAREMAGLLRHFIGLSCNIEPRNGAF